jgi:hypothetical protein
MPTITTRSLGAGAAAPCLLAALLMTPALSREDTHRHERLGKVDFKVECSAAAQQEFNHAMALYHSFDWTRAGKAFDAVAKTDPTCGMAHWGRAMVLLDNPFVWPANLPAAKLNEIAAALDAARSAGLKSERETAYVDAVTTLVRERDKLDHRTRHKAYDAAMEQLATRFPDDKEATILSALITSANFDPADKTYANQLKAARSLEPLFIAQPDHPGVAHYMIHSYDYPPIAKHGLEAAKRYARIAPDAPHALHMPSHIFTRVGHWQDSIESNRASAKAASRLDFDAHHATDYMVYAHLQLAQDQAARQATEDSLAAQPVDHSAASFAYAAMPARLALEVGNWKDVANLPLRPAADAYPWSKHPQAEAINAFARGVGAARSGDSEAANKERGRLVALRDVAKERKLGYWAEQIDIQAKVVEGLALIAEGKASKGTEVLRAAVAREDATEKHVVTPGPLLPAREVLADVLMENGNAREALSEYEAVLAKEPNRYRATLGAARAAKISGDAEKAKQRFTELIELASSADTERDGLVEARQFLAQK